MNVVFKLNDWKSLAYVTREMVPFLFKELIDFSYITAKNYDLLLQDSCTEFWGVGNIFFWK